MATDRDRAPQEAGERTYNLPNVRIQAELWDVSDSDNDSDGPIEDEHDAIFDCPGYRYMYARDQFQNLFQRHITMVSHISYRA